MYTAYISVIQPPQHRLALNNRITHKENSLRLKKVPRIIGARHLSPRVSSVMVERGMVSSARLS
jgi:hypothetical protein